MPRRRALFLPAFIAFGLPFLLGYGVLPLPNFINELASLLGLGFLLIVASQERLAVPRPSVWWMVMGALGLLLALLLLQAVGAGPRMWELQGYTAGYLVLAALGFHLGWRVGIDPRRCEAWMRPVAGAIAVAAVLAAGAGMLQYFKLPGNWALVPYLDTAGRAFGFIRQPNHQATFLAIGLLALVLLAQVGPASRTLAWLGAPLLAAGILATGSRMGLVLLCFVAAWSVWTRGRSMRAFSAYLLVTAIGLIAVFWYLHLHADLPFYGVAKVDQSLREGVGVRTLMWKETLSMIGDRPWLGYGAHRYGQHFILGEAAMATGAVMTHSHNLFLQLAFDYGVPAAGVVLTVLGIALWHATRTGASDPIRSCALGIVLCIGIHSLLEFPLWYIYFLALAAFMLGIALSASVWATPNDEVIQPAAREPAGLAIAGGVIVALAVWMNHDYYRVSNVLIGTGDTTLEQRIEAARNVTWFRRYVDYFALVRQPVTASNAETYRGGMSEIACTMLDPLYQSSLVTALAYQGRTEEARRLLYIYIRMSKGATKHLRERLKGHEGPVFDQLRRDLEQPVEIRLPPHRILGCLQ